ncbi:DegT/DnrJ/EryC1/StrS family aminotransferase [Paenibacillus sp. FSL H7-689]|uniref:DegT/DnrJ/EryC1/StrS family aminotransferase n=1 Tax=Paenibacillus sp. FSL H7-689 TaxID=1227349 RepID=UPI0003E1FBF0|nr:DegT/DnrJ/EryC1/StrS family aminotransferase [Paenibacillus sp. FSL H7-689]ETT44843.1 DegT/DnrJ/EryC1/StrS aminotransferase [Paenibacillus sp. FSL H7-689]
MYRIGQEEIDAVARVIKSKQFFRFNSEGKEVQNFESELSQKFESDYVLALSGGGTSALIAALVGLGVGPGDEVLVPSYTFIATPAAVLAVGAIPVIVEVDESLTMDVEDMTRKMSNMTKVAIPVHMCGFPCDMEHIKTICSERDIKIIEDACQAIGGTYQGQSLGTIGDAGTFSFNHFKTIGCGEGGALITSNKTIYERAFVYHDIGSVYREVLNPLDSPNIVGVQYRASEIMGAILREQLKRLDGILDDLRRIKGKFVDELSQVDGIRFNKSYDIDGDCGTSIAFIFDDETSAKAFAAFEGVQGMRPIESDKHVYLTWGPILEHIGSHHPSLNPFHLTQNRHLNMSYSKDMCPQTIDILSRTVILHLDPNMTEEDVDQRISSCKSAVYIRGEIEEHVQS